MTAQEKTKKVNFNKSTREQQSQESHGSRSWDPRVQSTEKQEDQNRTYRKERHKDKKQSTSVHDNVIDSSLHNVKKSSRKKHSKMSSVHYTLKDMFFN